MSEAAKKIEFEDEEEQTPEEIPVLDDMDAEYLLAQKRQALEQYEEMEAWYKFQLQKAKEVCDRTCEWVDRNLRPYFDTVPAKGKKIKTYELRGGVLKLSKQDPKFDVNDEVMVPWLEQNKQTEFVKITKEAKWGDFKKTLPKDKDGNLRTSTAEDGTIQLVTEDGEIVPGITVTPREDKFTVTVK